jgi:hypothetical protein
MHQAKSSKDRCALACQQPAERWVLAAFFGYFLGKQKVTRRRHTKTFMQQHYSFKHKFNPCCFALEDPAIAGGSVSFFACFLGTCPAELREAKSDSPKAKPSISIKNVRPVYPKHSFAPFALTACCFSAGAPALFVSPYTSNPQEYYY